MTQELDAAREERLHEAIAACYEAMELGRRPKLDDLLGRFPDVSEELKSFFADKERFDRLAEPLPPLRDTPNLGEAPTLAPGQTATDASLGTLHYFGDYELIEEIARGGMGVVFKAKQVSLNRTVALKMILAGHLASEADVQRFRTEAEAAANLDHPNIVPIYEVNQHQGQHYFSMKLIEGGSLAQRGASAEGRGGSEEAARLIATVARAVYYAHQRGILHRDLKPANILLDAKGEPHITDFGLAKRVGGDSKLTQSGAIVGTPSYMAPEQAGGKKGLTTAVDVYSLGAILYELLTGRPPFRAETPLDTLLQVMEREPERPRLLNPTIDRDLETICLKCLEKNPSQRYGSAEALAEDLEHWLAGEPISARPVTGPERFWRWCRRNPVVASLTAAVLALLVVIAITSTIQAIRIADREAETARQKEDAIQAQGVAVQRANEAEEARKQAVTERDAKDRALQREAGLRLTAQSSAALPPNPSLALLLGIEGAQRTPGVLANNALLAALDALHEERTLIVSHGGAYAAVFSADGQKLFTTGLDHRIALWEAASGKPLARLHGEGTPLHRSTAVLSPDGRHVATFLEGWFAIFFPNTEQFYTDRVVRLWDAVTGKPRLLLKGHADKIVAVAFSPDSRRLVTASWDKTARLWDVDTGKQLAVLEGDKCALAGVQFSADGQRVLAVSSGYVQFSTLPPRQAGNPRQLELDPLAFSPVDNPAHGYGRSGGSTTRWYSADTVLARVWDTESGKEVAALRRPAELPLLGRTVFEVHSGAFSPDGKRVLMLTLDTDPKQSVGVVRIFDAATGSLVTTIKSASGQLNTAVFSPDSTKLLTSGANVARLWNAADGKALAEYRGHRGSVDSAQFSPSGKQIVTVGGLDRTVRVWETATGEETTVFRGHEQPIRSAAFSPDGERVVTTADDGTVRIWLLNPARAHVRALAGHAGGIHQVAFSPDGGRALTGSDDTTARLWDTKTGKELFVLQGHAEVASPLARNQILHAVRTAAFSPDGHRVLTANPEEYASIRRPSLLGGAKEERVPFTPVRLWDADTGKLLFALPGHHAAVEVAAFSFDGKRVLTAETVERVESIFYSEGGRFRNSTERFDQAAARIFDTETGKETLALSERGGSIVAAEFSRDGRSILTASLSPSTGHFTVRVWDAATGKELHLIYDGLSNSPLRPSFSPDGRHVVWGFAWHMHVSDATTGKQVAELKNDAGGAAFATMSFSPDSRRLLIGDQGGAIRFWDFTNDQTLWLKGHTQSINALAISRDGKLIASASVDQTACVWDAATGKELYTLSGHVQGVLAVAFSPDGKQVITGSSDGTARIWRLDFLSIALSKKPRELTPQERERFEVGAAVK
jgi:WD40 repeat protein